MRDDAACRCNSARRLYSWPRPSTKPARAWLSPWVLQPLHADLEYLSRCCFSHSPSAWSAMAWPLSSCRALQTAVLRSFLHGAVAWEGCWGLGLQWSHIYWDFGLKKTSWEVTSVRYILSLWLLSILQHKVWDIALCMYLRELTTPVHGKHKAY